MTKFTASDILFFFGAGASAPFGIPTMKQFVVEFEEYLSKHGTTEEKEYYGDVKSFLSRSPEGDPPYEPDLEQIFTVIDGYPFYEHEIELVPSYFIDKHYNPISTKEIQTVGKWKISLSLTDKFKKFVRQKCEVPEGSFDHIASVYQDFFNRFVLELPTPNSSNRDGFYWADDWTIFTTNYDLILEYYWREVARVGIETGFEFNKVRHANVLSPSKFLQENIRLQLIKLHGSINWLIEESSSEVFEEEMTGGYSLMGRKFAGEMMIYPLEKKERHLNPYISMLLRFNQELEKKSVWVIIGYSFNDHVLREIFEANCDGTKTVILIHPDASMIDFSFEVGREGALHYSTIPMDVKFGLKESFREVNHQIINELIPKSKPKYGPEKTPT